MSAEATEDFQMLYEDLQIKYHTERLIIVQKVQFKLFFSIQLGLNSLKAKRRISCENQRPQKSKQKTQ